MDEMQKFKLELLVEELEKYKARHTELITVLIPGGSNIHQTTNRLEDERGTAANIKSASTRKNVSSALDMIIRKLKEINQTPKNGLALFSGNVISEAGLESLKIWAIEPPKELNIKTYRCDQSFFLDPLKEMLETDEVYGLVIIERSEATIGILDGKVIKQLKHMTSGIPSKQRSGGQSAARFGRIAESMAKDFYKHVAEAMKFYFWDNKKLKGILVGGPIPTKDEFLDQGQLATALKNKVIAVKNLGGSEMNGLQELVILCQDILSEQEITKQKKILDLFFECLGKNPNKVSYGEVEVEDRLILGAVDKLIISKSLGKVKIKKFEELAKETSTEIYIVTNENSNGVQFDSLGGIGGLLRFEVYN